MDVVLELLLGEEVREKSAAFSAASIRHVVLEVQAPSANRQAVSSVRRAGQLEILPASPGRATFQRHVGQAEERWRGEGEMILSADICLGYSNSARSLGVAGPLHMAPRS